MKKKYIVYIPLVCINYIKSHDGRDIYAGHNKINTNLTQQEKNRTGLRGYVGSLSNKRPCLKTVKYLLSLVHDNDVDFTFYTITTDCVESEYIMLLMNFTGVKIYDYQTILEYGLASSAILYSPLGAFNKNMKYRNSVAMKALNQTADPNIVMNILNNIYPTEITFK